MNSEYELLHGEERRKRKEVAGTSSTTHARTIYIHSNGARALRIRFIQHAVQNDAIATHDDKIIWRDPV